MVIHAGWPQKKQIRRSVIGFYVRNTINFHERLDLNNNEIETLTIEISKPKSNHFS
jgi:hypothetical protein